MKTKIIIIALIATIANGCGGSPKTQTNAGSTSSKPAVAATSTPSSNGTAPAASSTAKLKPGDVTPDKPIAATELNQAFFADQAGWKGKVVTVTGNYHSHTTSTNASGRSIRIDIADTAGKKVANCAVAAEPTKEEVAKRENRIFKGTVKEAYFNEVMLDPCEMVKP